MLHSIRRFWPLLIGAPLEVIGLGGAPDDLSKWRKWLEEIPAMINHDAVRVVFVAVGLLLIFWPIISPEIRAAQIFSSVVFGKPENHTTETNIQWWHIPIYIRRWRILLPIRECSVRVYFDGIEADSAGIKMHWQTGSGLHDDGVPSLTLRRGNTYFIPFFYGREPPPRSSFATTSWFTDSEYMNHRDVNVRWFPRDSVRLVEVVIVSSEGKKWKSGRNYRVIVPQNLGLTGFDVSEQLIRQ